MYHLLAQYVTDYFSYLSNCRKKKKPENFPFLLEKIVSHILKHSVKFSF